jgi:hypothetical protein
LQSTACADHCRRKHGRALQTCLAGQRSVQLSSRCAKVATHARTPSHLHAGSWTRRVLISQRPCADCCRRSAATSSRLAGTRFSLTLLTLAP